MSETWVLSATRRPGPVNKQGYDNISFRQLDGIKGEIKHSMAGNLAGAWSRLDGPDRASWTFSITRIGELYQHYPLESITWHGGGPEVNQSYVGVEHEGGPPGDYGEPLSEAQYQTTLALTRELRALLPHLGPPARATNLREHNEFAATACPSGRIPWDRLIADLTAPPSLPGPNGLSLEERIAALEAALSVAVSESRRREDVIMYALQDTQAGLSQLLEAFMMAILKYQQGSYLHPIFPPTWGI